MSLNLAMEIGARLGTSQRSSLLSFLSRVSIAGLVLGVALLIVVLSVMNGFERELENKILGLVPQASVVNFQPQSEWRSIAEGLEAHPEVEAVAPFVHLQGMLSHRREVAPALIHGIYPEWERKVSAIGDVLDRIEAAQGDERIIAIGAGIADSLGVEEGQRINLVVPSALAQTMPRVERFKIIAVFKTGTQLDNSLAIIPLPQAAELAGRPGAVQGFRLKVSDLFDAYRIAWEAAQSLDPVFYIRDWSGSHGNLYTAVQMSRSMVSLLLMIIIAIAVFNVVTALIMGVLDKQGEIAILRAMGAGTGTVIGAFFVQGAVIGVTGVGLGVLFGCILAYWTPDLAGALESVMGIRFLNTTVYPIDYLPSDIRLSDVLSVAFAAMGMALTASLYPAWRASRLNPADVLRYE